MVQTSPEHKPLNWSSEDLEFAVTTQLVRQTIGLATAQASKALFNKDRVIDEAEHGLYGMLSDTSRTLDTDGLATFEAQLALKTFIRDHRHEFTPETAGMLMEQAGAYISQVLVDKEYTNPAVAATVIHVFAAQDGKTYAATLHTGNAVRIFQSVLGCDIEPANSGSLGISTSVDQYKCQTIELQPGNRLIFCSAGITGYMSAQPMGNEVVKTATLTKPQKAAEYLLQARLNMLGDQNGGRDSSLLVLDAPPAVRGIRKSLTALRALGTAGLNMFGSAYRKVNLEASRLLATVYQHRRSALASAVGLTALDLCTWLVCKGIHTVGDLGAPSPDGLINPPQSTSEAGDLHNTVPPTADHPIGIPPAANDAPPALPPLQTYNKPEDATTVWSSMQRQKVPSADIMPRLYEAAKRAIADGQPLSWHQNGTYEWLEVNGKSDVTSVLQTLEPYLVRS